MTDAATHEWGRIDEDGNVYVRTPEGERLIGQWLGGTPEEGLAMYARRFEGLQVEVELLEKRLGSGAVSPDDAAKAVAKVRAQVTDAQALGDLASLFARLEAFAPLIDKQREERKAARAARAEETAAAKNRISAEAEKIAEGTDWRHGADRLRVLLDEWKALPRIDRKTDDELWHRFSSARTAYTRKRKTHFAEQSSQRGEAQGVKQKLVEEAQALSGSTDWGPTAGKYRDLMTRWKAAGPAPRGAEDRLWKAFRAAQDAFFTARDETNAALDAEYEVNAEKKLVILADAEALLPIKDVDAARRAWHDIADRWEAAGKVPRAKVKEFEGRIRVVEQAIREAGDAQWRKSDPEKSARADDMIGKLQKAIDDIRADLDKAQAAGDAKKIKDLEDNLASREAFLEMAKKAASDFS